VALTIIEDRRRILVGILNTLPAQMMVKPKTRVVPGEDHRQGREASQDASSFRVVFKARRFNGS
jgi:hypothetical protein